MQGLTAQASGAAATAADLRRAGRESWKQDQPQAALDLAWAAFELAPADRATKAFVAELLRHYPDKLHGDRRAAYLSLLTDQEVEPNVISTAGWRLLFRAHGLAASPADDGLEALTAVLEGDELALALLRQAPVGFAPAERLVTRLRRWLLLSGQWPQHPALVTALKTQAGLNGGAWPFDDSERALLTGADCQPMIAAYLPVRQRKQESAAVDWAAPVTRAVATQYEGWPYPAWTRITIDEAKRLPDAIAAMDPELAKTLPVAADMLIAGCGTGRQAASVALRYPDAKVTAIDISEASLDYGRRQCAKLGIGNVRFIRLDLHDAAQLGQRFHAIHCTGVLHHLPDPERGLKLLVGVLHPGGVMRIMVYNRHQRLMIMGARQFLIGDLLQEPVTDDLIRRVRGRFLDQPDNPAAALVMRSRDFATLASAHDLLLHRHEDPFDVKRIRRALDRAGLSMLSFDMPSPVMAARYDAMFPGDPRHRDFASFERFEMKEPAMIRQHYRFWCCLPRRPRDR